MSQLRLLCLGDNHGLTSSLERVISETEGSSFDFVVHVGDITNACIDGLDDGVQQLDEVEPLLEELADRGPLVYVWGNRDYEVCHKGVGTRVNEQAGFDFDVGTHVPVKETVEVNGQEFTQNPDAVTDDTILVTHYFQRGLLDNFDGRLYVSGHVHVGRFKDNVLNTAFLSRGDVHGGRPMDGGYFVVEIDEDDSITVTVRSLDGLKKGICPRHAARGVQFVPSHWRQDCKFCYDDGEEEFLSEIVASARYALERDGRELTEANLIERATEMYEGSNVPRSFESRLATFVDEADDLA